MPCAEKSKLQCMAEQFMSTSASTVVGVCTSQASAAFDPLSCSIDVTGNIQSACHRQNTCIFPVIHADMLYEVNGFRCTSNVRFDYYLDLLYNCRETGDHDTFLQTRSRPKML